jgi:PBP1b-binding outer membrane lipoprotein LpoB
MKKLPAILFALWTAIIASGCAEQPHSPFNSADQQRANAEKAQGEMSSDVKK